MKLFMLHSRDGFYTRTFFKPRTVTPEEVEAGKVELAGIPPWILLPDSTGTKYGPSLKLVMEWVYYLWTIGMFTLQLRGAALHGFINGWLAKWAAQFVVGMKAGVVFYYVGIPALILLLFYIVNPEFRVSGGIGHYPGQYIGLYQNRMWWLDLQMISAGGVGWYFNCGEIPAQIQQHRRSVAGPRRLDYLTFQNSWTFLKKVGILEWRYYVWDSATVEYIGMLGKVLPNWYTLRPPTFNPYLSEAPPFWRSDPDTWCYKHFTIP